MKKTQIARLDDTPMRVRSTQLEKLNSRIDGPLLAPGDNDWNGAARIWNGMVQKVPALIVQPASARDVAQVVGFARVNGLRLSVKGGGHNIAGTSIADGGLTLDMSRMRRVAIDPDAKLARVGPGCVLGDVDAATQEHGLATALGFMSETGIAGLTLGGGFGYLTRRFGFTVDNLDEVEIVTADGEVRTANGSAHSDLFWALRGGGGNFGVATRFTFRLHNVEPTVTSGQILWSAERIEELLAAYRDLTESAPRELTLGVLIGLAPPAPFIPEAWRGKPVTGIIVCHSGKHAARDLAALRAIREPIVDLVTERPYIEQQRMMDAMEPAGHHYYWKSEYLDGLLDGFLDALSHTTLTTPSSPMSNTRMLHIGGALNDHGDNDGAVGNRDARYIVGFAGAWPPGEPGDIEWVRQRWESIRSFSTGGNYINFQTADEGDERTAASYGTNLERLRRIKAVYDPTNLFRANRNISPSPVLAPRQSLP